jgi:hypothetical protein
MANGQLSFAFLLVHRRPANDTRFGGLQAQGCWISFSWNGSNASPKQYVPVRAERGGFPYRKLLSTDVSFCPCRPLILTWIVSDREIDHFVNNLFGS